MDEHGYLRIVGRLKVFPQVESESETKRESMHETIATETIFTFICMALHSVCSN